MPITNTHITILTMNKRFYTFLILAFNFIAVISQSQAPTITFGRLSDYEKSVNEPLHIILTQKESVMKIQVWIYVMRRLIFISLMFSPQMLSVFIQVR